MSECAMQDPTYQAPPRFPVNMTIAERLALEPKGYEPVQHQGTGVSAEEALYTSCLLPIETAVDYLGRTTISADVIRRGWEAICERIRLEEIANEGTS
jgi:hypothetical protein